ncbi:MAG: Rrf2 family transcriptional regulator [Clostridia bacterium]|nr:Rrf2 family transcriptional regulator [Clostridia bacterium]
MRLSVKGKYALYAMHYLALHAGKGTQPLRAIAKTGIPDPYLEQILGSLRRAGLLKTSRGVLGGYELSKDPALITVGDIIEATEGPVSFSDCLSEQAPCHKSGSCAARAVWERLTGGINDILNGITLADMLTQSALTDGE